MGQQPPHQHDDGAQAEAAFVKHQHVAMASPDLSSTGTNTATTTTTTTSTNHASSTFGITNPNHGSSFSSPPVSGVPVSKLKKVELFLRLVSFLTSLSAFVFFITDKQTNTFRLYTSDIVQEARYTDSKALVYSVIVLAIAAVYSILQLVKVLIIDYSSLAPESAFSWAIFLCDQVIAYLILSASSAATQVAWLSEQGNSDLGWMMVCNLYGKFCKQVGVGIVSAFLAFLAFLFSSGISSFNLFASSPQD